jgi:bifunctional non-homologous end joining protein LigD
MTRFLVHRHTAGRRHFDLRLVQDDRVRSWSMLKEPPLRARDKRLAIEREDLPIEVLGRQKIEEEAFGTGRVQVWDGGEVTEIAARPEILILTFGGTKMQGRYELRRMKWYPGNRWLLEKSASSGSNLT